jgi:hypothetical protein
MTQDMPEQSAFAHVLRERAWALDDMGYLRNPIPSHPMLEANSHPTVAAVRERCFRKHGASRAASPACACLAGLSLKDALPCGKSHETGAAKSTPAMYFHRDPAASALGRCAEIDSGRFSGPISMPTS